MRFKAQFKALAGVAASIAALGLSAWLLANSSAKERWYTAVAAAAGLLIYGAYKLVRRKSDAENVVQSTRT
jgi:hypothetical protein